MTARGLGPEVRLNIHIKKLLRHYVYRDTNQTFFRPPSRDQADQCIETLREHLVCTCDATPYLIANDARFGRGVAPVTATAHYCRDFDRLLGWARDRFVLEDESPGDGFL